MLIKPYLSIYIQYLFFSCRLITMERQIFQKFNKHQRYSCNSWSNSPQYLDFLCFIVFCCCCPATRAKMSMMSSMSRIRGQEKGPGYTQTETILGESMQRFGRELGEDSHFGEAVGLEAKKHRTTPEKESWFWNLTFVAAGLVLIDVGEAMRELGEVKDALDMEVKQNFIDPMQNLHEKDLREIQVECFIHSSSSSSWAGVCPLTVSLTLAAPPEEAGRSPSGLWLQEEAPGQSDGGRAQSGAGEVRWLQGSRRAEHVQPAGEWRKSHTSTAGPKWYGALGRNWLGPLVLLRTSPPLTAIQWNLGWV